MKQNKQRYKIIFSGNILPGHTVSEVANRFSYVFKLKDKGYLQQLFSGKTITLKRELTYEQAQRYSLILTKLGADCCIERRQSCFEDFSAETDDNYKRKKQQPLVQFGPSNLAGVGLVPK